MEERKVKSIEFVQDAVRYRATVGEVMSRQSLSRDPKEARMGVMNPPTQTTDLVVDIQPGLPVWLVFLDPERPTHWANPFMVGEPNIRSVSYLDEEGEA